MDEQTIKFLELNGYQYYNGAILDKDGKYISTLELRGKTINSEVDENFYNEDRKVADKNQKNADLKSQFKNFENDPISNSITKTAQQAYPTFAAEQREKGIPAYDTAEEFVKYEEEKVSGDADDTFVMTARELQGQGYEGIDDEYVAEYKDNESAIKKMEAKNPSYHVAIDKRLKSNEKLMEEKSWYDPSLYMDLVWSGALGVSKLLSSSTAGMGGETYGEHKKDRQEYTKQLAKRKELLEPLITIQKGVLETKQKELENIYDKLSITEKYDPSDKDNRLLEYGIGELKKEKDRLQASLDGSIVYNPFNKDFGGDLATLGLGDAYDMYVYNSYLNEKITKGEELTEKEKLVANSLANIHKSKGLKVEQTTGYGLTEGTLESAKFLIGGLPGRVVLKGTTKALTLGLSKAVTKGLAGTGKMSFRTAIKTGNYTGLVGGESVNMLGQAILHPNSTIGALNKYHGEILFDTNEDGKVKVTTDRRTYNTIIEESEIESEKIIQQLVLESDPEKSQKLHAQLKKIDDYVMSLERPSTALNAVGYGLSEVAKENVIENYGGRAVGKAFNNSLTKKALNKPWVRAVKNSAVAKKVTQLDNMFSGVKKKYNDFLGDRGTKLIGGNFEEMAEEVVTQLVPVWGETDEEAVQRRGELLEASFYGQVAGQTLLMGGLMKAVYSPLTGYNAYVKSQDLKDKKKGFQDMVATFKKEGVSEGDVERVLMSMGEGNLSVQAYNNQIYQLRKEKKFNQANNIERNKYYNIGKSLVSIGKGKEFVREMETLLFNGQIPTNSVLTVQESIKEVHNLEKEMKEFEGLRNRDYILQLKSKLRYNKNLKSQIEKEKSRVESEEKSDDRDAKILLNENHLQDNKNLETRLEKALAIETSPQMVKKLQQEAEVTADIIKEFNKVKENTGYTETAKRLALEKVKEKYGTTVKKSVYADSMKNLERHSLKEILNETLQRYKEANKESTQEPAPQTQADLEESQSLEGFTTSVNEVTEAIEQVQAKGAPINIADLGLEDTEQVVTSDNVLENDLNEFLVNEKEILEKIVKDSPNDKEAKKDLENFNKDSIAYLKGRVDFNLGMAKDFSNEKSDVYNKETADGFTRRANDAQKLYDAAVTKQNKKPEPQPKEKAEDVEDSTFWDEMLPQEDGSFENKPFNKMVETTKSHVGKMTEREGVKPTFEEYIRDVKRMFGISHEDFKRHFKSFGIAWGAAKLGESNWRDLYNKQYLDVEGYKEELREAYGLTEVVEEVETEEEVIIQQQEEAEVVNTKSTATPIKFIPESGKPVYVTPNQGKTFGTDFTLGYSAIEYENTFEIVDGKKVYRKVSAAIPKLNETSSTSFKDLVNPNKNNIGDKLKPVVGDLTAPIVVNRDEFGIQIGNPISFSQWVSENKPDEMTFEKFQESDAYIGKIPMMYEDAEGNKLTYIHEVDWYGISSVGDRDKETAEVDFNNPSPGHLKDIQDNKDQILELRKQILSGQVEEVEIIDNLGMFPLQIIAREDADGNLIPTKKLNEVSPDSKVVWMQSTGALIGLDGKAINNKDIINIGDSDKGFLKSEYRDVNGVPVPQVKNGAKTHYMVHVATLNGVKKYFILQAKRVDENNNNVANKEDVNTARIVAAASNILKYDKSPSGRNVAFVEGHPNSMTYEEAVEIQRQIEEITRVDIKKHGGELVESLIALIIPGVNGKEATKQTFFSRFSNNLLGFNKETGEFTTPDSEFTQNTKFDKQDFQMSKRPVISVKKVNGSYVVEKIKITSKVVDGETVTEANNYEDFLKERLSTNVMGYNVGTELEPVYTIAVQQQVKIRPIVKEVISAENKFKDSVKELIKDVAVQEKVAEVEKTPLENNPTEVDVVAKPKLTQEQKDKRKEVVERATALAKRLNLDIRDINSTDDMIVGEMTTVENVASAINIVEGLTIKQEEDIIKWIFSKYANIENDAEAVKFIISGDLTLKIEELQNSLAELEAFGDNVVIQNLQSTLESALDQAEMSLENVDKLIFEASTRSQEQKFILDEYGVDENVVSAQDFSKTSSETKPIDKVGTKLKRVFAQVSNGKTGFLGLDSYDSFKQMYDTVLLYLSSNNNLNPNFNEMMALLEDRKDSTPWMKPLIKVLKESDDQTKTQFVYNTYKQKVNAKFATLSFNDRGEVVSNIYDSNSNEAKRSVVNKWEENFKRSPINNGGLIDKKVLEEVKETWINWAKNGGVENQTNEEYQKWLSNFGIELSDGAWKALRNAELNVSEAGRLRKIVDFQELFGGLTGTDKASRSGLLFSNLMKYSMLKLESTEDVEFYENTTNHPFKDMNIILSQLAELESKYNPVYGSTSRYVAGKSLTEVEIPTYFYEQIKKLKKSALSDDKKYLNELGELSFSKDSYLLELLKTDDIFANQFGHSVVEIMALKELYKKSPMFAGIDELSSFDYMFTQRAMFQNRNQGQARSIDGMPFDVRMSHLNTLTNSDKGRMMLLKTGVFDLYRESEKAFEIKDNGSVAFTEDLQSLLYSQLVMPELRRITTFIDRKLKTNINSYDSGATRFNALPILNTILNSNGLSIKEFLDLSEENVEKTLVAVQESFGSEINRVLEENIVNEAKANVQKLQPFLEDGTDKFNNVEYLQFREGTIEDNMLVSELDFTINSMITNMNYMSLVAGDPALYFKNPKLEANTKDLVIETRISQVLAINLGKRMAAMIAPGSSLANSNDNDYIQIFLEDVIGTADNIIDIIEMHYGKAELDKTHENGMTYREMARETVNGQEYNTILKDKFSRIKDFIGIETTDAQEYTTLNEHIYVMLGQGNLSQSEHDSIIAKLKEGKDLTKEELNIVMQPLKPVVTGTMLDPGQDVNRVMYIKSSSFPLIPQLTRGRKLDDLRIQMEKVEAAEGTTVRASYQTANKVGGLTEENTVKSFDQAIMPNNYLRLPRINFRIQQDVPFKSDKVQDDTVSMGTQIFKLLMGDGIMEMDNFDFEGKTYTGKELKAEFHRIFSGMIGLKRSKFLKSIGLDENMNSADEDATSEKVKELLIKEAKSRGFSKQDLKILELVKDINGKKIFRLPLWLTGNSNKYESMLNALINNKIFKQKIPGNKSVTVSEAGFAMKEGMNNVDNPSRIVHLGNFKGGTLQSTRLADGTITKAQILVPSKFKLDGKLIDLFKDFDGENGLYLHKVDGIVKIKEGMIDPKLLEQFVFRIPTSSHGLGSSVEVVGFLPPESGDMIVTPKGFIAQMGQDFDIDSLTAYQYHHIVREDGKIERLDGSHLSLYTSEIESKLRSFEERVNNLYAGDVKALQKIQEEISELIHTLDPDTGAAMQDKGVEFDELFEKLDNKYSLKIDILDAQLEKIEDDFKRKVLENQFVGIHNSVYSNPQAQQQINKALSMAYAEKQAEDIQALTMKEDNSFNILSPQYQMYKMNAGSTGSVGIGIYAKGVTLHSSIQQAVSEGNYVGLGVEEAGKDPINKGINIGKLSSTGALGRLLAINQNPIFDSIVRRISTVLDERANTATDNEKAQILGRTGLNNKEAIAVDSLLSLLGFDSEYNVFHQSKDSQQDLEAAGKAGYKKGEPFHRELEIEGKMTYFTEHSVPYLLHSQPIIKEYFDLINEMKSIVTDGFAAKPSEIAIEELLAKYGNADNIIVGGQLRSTYTDVDGKPKSKSLQNNEQFTAEMLQNQIKLGQKSTPKFQLQILALYTDLMQQAKNVQKLDQHTDLNNLGKSMWESTTKAKEFREYFMNPKENGLIGSTHLVGEVDYISELEKVAPTQQNIKTGVPEVFEESSELSKIGTEEQYSQYLDTVFPDSKLKEIVYHATSEVFEEFKVGEYSQSIFFAPTREEAWTQKGSIMVSAILNSTNPLIIKNDKFPAESEDSFDASVTLYTKDYVENLDGDLQQGGEYFQEISVDNPGQIHILGSKEDIQGFTEFVKTNTPSATTSQTPIIDLGENIGIRPTTNQGVMVATALSLSEHSFSNLFPAKNTYVNSIMEKIFTLGNINVENSFAVTRAKEEIFQEIKRYLTTSEFLGLFNKSPKEVREDLYMDIPEQGHVSLSSYTGNLFKNKDKDFKEGIDKVKNNLFLNYLKYEYGENGKPSLISFNNQESFEANQEAIYASLKQLIAEDYPLPNKNGEAFSTRKLAQELTAYSYVGGGIIQGALEFHKFLPIEYLDDMAYQSPSGNTPSVSRQLRKYHNLDKGRMLEDFIKQYFQNNPTSVKQVKMTAYEVNGDTYYKPTEETTKKYLASKVATKSKLKKDKWKLYEKVGDTPNYKEIEILGETGMAEYEFQSEDATSIIGKERVAKVTATPMDLKTVEDAKLGTIPESGSKIISFLNAIKNGEYGDYSNMKEIAEYFMKFIDENQTFTYKDMIAKGRVSEGELFLNPSKNQSNEDLATTFMHESAHVLTSSYVNQYLDEFGNLVENAPRELQGLNTLMEEYKKQIVAQDKKGYDAFTKKWETYQKERSQNLPSTVSLTTKEASVFYSTVNLKEFIAVNLGNNKEYKEVASQMVYLESGKNILQKFGQLITDLIKRISITEGIPENSIALQSLELSFAIVKASYNQKQKAKKVVEKNPNVSQTEMDDYQKYIEQMNQEQTDFANRSSDNLLPLMELTSNLCQ
jgi:hypothetical protein